MPPKGKAEYNLSIRNIWKRRIQNIRFTKIWGKNSFQLVQAKKQKNKWAVLYINPQLQSLYERTSYTAEQQIKNRKMQKILMDIKIKEKKTNSKGGEKKTFQSKLNFYCVNSLLIVRMMEIKLLLSVQDSETPNTPKKCLA